MSNVGRPSVRDNGEGNPNVPPDLVFPCTIYTCSGNLEHTDECDETCESWEPTENQVKLQNIAREYARNRMSFVGIPQGVPVPIPGISVDLVEVLCRIMAIEEMLFPLVGIEREEFDEKYREHKIEFLQSVLDANKDEVRKARVANSLGIVQHPGLLGPNGEPIL